MAEIDVERQCRRYEQRHHDERDLQELEVDVEQEHDDVGGDDEPPQPAGHVLQPCGDAVLATQPIEHEREERRGEEDLKDQALLKAVASAVATERPKT